MSGLSPQETKLSAEHWRTPPPALLDADGPTDHPFVPFPAPLVQRPIIELFEAAVRRGPERMAIDDGRTRMTFAEALEAVRATARRIAAEAPPGPIALLLPHSAVSITSMLGCLAAGRVVLPRDLDSPAEHNVAVLADARPAALLVSGEIDQYANPTAVPVIRINDVLPMKAGVPCRSNPVWDRTILP